MDIQNRPASDRKSQVELSDLELLAQATQEAMDARDSGVIAGPDLDEVALRRAERRARRSDLARLVNNTIPDEEASA